MSDLKIISWNVNGLKSVLNKDSQGIKSTIAKLTKEEKHNSLSVLINDEHPDILCLQEIKCSNAFDHQVFIPDYPYQYANYSNQKGYSGTLVASKIMPNEVRYNFEELADTIPLDDDINKLLREGRVITVYYDTFVLVNVYAPNSGINGLLRLDIRVNKWESLMRMYLTKISNNGLNIVLIGDLNVVLSTINSNYKLLTYSFVILSSSINKHLKL